MDDPFAMQMREAVEYPAEQTLYTFLIWKRSMILMPVGHKIVEVAFIEPLHHEKGRVRCIVNQVDDPHDVAMRIAPGIKLRP